MMKIVDKILNWLPVIIPVPTAYTVGDFFYDRLGWPMLVVVIAALGAECAGFVATDTAAK